MHRFTRNTAALLIIDVQERLIAAMNPARVDRLVNRTLAAIDGAKALGMPIIVTEQYPKGLGPTVPELAEFAADRPAKTRFSCAECLGWLPPSPEEPFQIVVAGIEAHVCILQTVLDLLALGYQVHVAVDAVSDRIELDMQISLRRMELSGAVLTTAETVLFEWCEVAGTPEFKAISKLVTGR